MKMNKAGETRDRPRSPALFHPSSFILHPFPSSRLSCLADTTPEKWPVRGEPPAGCSIWALKEAHLMVRKLWAGALAGVLACAPASLAQAPRAAAPNTAAPQVKPTAERVITVKEAGKPAQKCR